jgi:hypothetical protein
MSSTFILRNSDSVLTPDFDLEPGLYDKQLPKPHTRGPPSLFLPLFPRFEDGAKKFKSIPRETDGWDHRGGLR